MAKDNKKDRNPAASKQEKSRDIDVSSANLGEKDSDSELDIQALLRKYMPEFDKDETEPAKNSLAEDSILAGLRSATADTALDFEEEALPAANDDADVTESLQAIRWHREPEPEEGEPITLDGEDDPEDSFAALMKSSDGMEDLASSDFDFTDDIPAEPEESELEDEEGIYESDDESFSRTPRRAKEKGPKLGLFSFGRKEKKTKKKAKQEEEIWDLPEEPVETEDLPADLFAQEDDLSADAIADSMGLEEELLSPEAESELAGAFAFAEDADLSLDEDLSEDVSDELLRELIAEPDLPFAADEKEAETAAPMSDEEMLKLAEEMLNRDAMADTPGEEEPVPAEEESVGEEPMDQPFGDTVSDEDFDPTDINLMVAFGMEDGAAGKKKSRTARQLGDKLEHENVAREGKKVKLDRPEYVDVSQNATIIKGFRNKLIGLWIRLGICSVLTLMLMIFENVETLSKLLLGKAVQFGGALDPAIYPVVYAMVSLQIMLLACLCAHEQILRGFGCLFRGVPKPESMTALLTVGGILYTAIIARITIQSEEPVMFNFVVAMAALMTLVGDIFATKREQMNFRIVSSDKEKHIVCRVADEQSRGEATAFSEEEDACDVMRIEKTDFIDGFFNRLYTPDGTTNVFMSCAMGIMVAAAVLFGLFTSFRGGTGVEVARVVCVTMMVLAPLSVYLSFSYPFYRATKVADAFDSAIIGESSLGEYSNASIVTFDDKNVFPSYSVKVQNIRIFNNARIDRVLYYASSVFAKAGGPLQDVFEIATLEVGHSDNVQILETETGFLAAEVDGVNIIFGSGAALTKKEFRIRRQEMEDDVDLSDELSIMYMFREDRLVAKMYIQYVMDGDIELILSQFQNSGLYGCVRTFDPNIDERMIAKKVKMKRIPLKVIRYSEPEEVDSYSTKVDSGLVTCGSPKSLLQIISYCDKVLHTKKTNIAMAILALLIGAAIMLLLVLSGSIGVVNSLFIMLYQLLWLVPMMFSSKMFIR